jgi:hypothetical protein
MKTLLLSFLILIMPNSGFTAGKKLTDREREEIAVTIQHLLTGLVDQVMISVKHGVSSAIAQAQIKETFARQKVAGKPFHADAILVETSLRLVFRANAGRLQFGNSWRSYPTDKAYAEQAEKVAKALEKHVAKLGQIRNWNCSYDKEASRLMEEAMTPLVISGRLGLKKQPEPPPYTKMEEKFKFGSLPPELQEAKPKKNEKSALWLDWAAAHEIEQSIAKMKEEVKPKPPKKPAQKLDPIAAHKLKQFKDKIKSENSATQTKASTPLLSPERTHIKEAIKLWAMATAAENNSPAPKLSNERLEKETSLIVAIIMKKYEKAFSDEIHDCQFDDFVSNNIGRAAKRLLIKTDKAEKKKQK